jgi:putative endonuclease
MFITYILRSLIKNRYYIGHTEDIKNRLKRHNAGKVKSTKNGRPWVIIYTEEFNTKSESYRRELQIKSYKGGRAFKNLIKNKKH